jgi:hypothetical protein
MNVVAMLAVAGISLVLTSLFMALAGDHEKIAFWMFVSAGVCFTLAAGLGIAP